MSTLSAWAAELGRKPPRPLTSEHLDEIALLPPAAQDTLLALILFEEPRPGSKTLPFHGKRGQWALDHLPLDLQGKLVAALEGWSASRNS